MITAAFIFTSLGIIAGYLLTRNKAKMVIIGKNMSEDEKQWWIALGFERNHLDNYEIIIVKEP